MWSPPPPLESIILASNRKASAIAQGRCTSAQPPLEVRHVVLYSFQRLRDIGSTALFHVTLTYFSFTFLGNLFTGAKRGQHSVQRYNNINNTPLAKKQLRLYTMVYGKTPEFCFYSDQQKRKKQKLDTSPNTRSASLVGNPLGRQLPAVHVAFTMQLGCFCRKPRAAIAAD